MKNTLLFFVFSILIGVVLILGLIILNSNEKIVNNFGKSGNTLYGISYPPIENLNEGELTADYLKDLGVDRVRIGTEWKFREAKKGDYNWEPLDFRVKLLNDNGFSILLTISANGPNWACSELRNEHSCVYTDIEDFKNFISQLANRYSGKIDKIQFGNEWDSDFWFVGTSEDFVDYTNIVYGEFKEKSPKTVVVLGGVTKSVPVINLACNKKDESLIYPVYFNAGNNVKYKKDILKSCEFNTAEKRVSYVLQNAKYDLADLYLYDDIENWDVYYNDYLNSVKVPVIVSEFGVQEGFRGREHSEEVQNALRKLEQMNVPEAYYFNLVDTPGILHDKSGIVYENFIKKKAFFVFKQFLS